MLTRAIFRALCALLVGFLLVSNPTEMTVLLVQIIGGIFSFSGLVAIISYFTARIRQSGFRMVFPVVGIGSLAFGVFLLFMPELFVSILMYVLGVLLALIGIGQIINLINYRQFSPLTWSLFVLPLLIIATGVFLICYPLSAASLPFTILGVAYIIYGISEFLLGIRFYRYQRVFMAEQQRLQAEAEAMAAETATHDAEAVEISSTTEDITDPSESATSESKQDEDNDETPTSGAPSSPLPSILLALALICSSTIVAQTTQFTVAAMNVDGLPAKIATISINPDSKGSAGAQAISQKLATKSYDIIGMSEDFNYHGSIMSAISETYNQGTHRGSINAGTTILSLLAGLTFDTDGLELLWKKDLNITSESWTRWNKWNGKTDSGADGLIKKGFRYYLADVGNGALVDIYILHMDAEISDGDIAARESQMQQLVDDILRINPSTRPKIVMGDTNCRYTRDRLKSLFIDAINADGRYTIKDAWIEKCKKNVYPSYGSNALMASDLGYVEGEIVDKIFYINPKYGMQLQLRSFKVDTDFNDDSGEPLADHYPVVADFAVRGTLYDPASYWDGNYNDAAYTAYAQAYRNILPYTKSNMSNALKEELNNLLTSRTNATAAAGEEGTTAQLLAFPNKVKQYLEEKYEMKDYTSRIQNPSFEEGQRLANGNVSGWSVPTDVTEAFISGIEDNDEGAAIRAFAPIDGQYVFNTWGGTPAKGFYCQQSVVISSGWYLLTATVASDSSNEVLLRLGDNLCSSGPLTDRSQGTTIELIAFASGKSVIGAESTGWFECDDFRLTYFAPIPSAIESPETATSGEQSVPAIYDLTGRQMGSLKSQQGLYIFRDANGTTRKAIVR